MTERLTAEQRQETREAVERYRIANESLNAAAARGLVPRTVNEKYGNALSWAAELLLEDGFAAALLDEADELRAEVERLRKELRRAANILEDSQGMLLDGNDDVLPARLGSLAERLWAVFEQKGGEA